MGLANQGIKCACGETVWFIRQRNINPSRHTPVCGLTKYDLEGVTSVDFNCYWLFLFILPSYHDPRDRWRTVWPDYQGFATEVLSLLREQMNADA